MRWEKHSPGELPGRFPLGKCPGHGPNRYRDFTGVYRGFAGGLPRTTGRLPRITEVYRALRSFPRGNPPWEASPGEFPGRAREMPSEREGNKKIDGNFFLPLGRFSLIGIRRLMEISFRHCVVSRSSSIAVSRAKLLVSFLVQIRTALLP